MLPFDNKSEFQIVIDMPEGTPLKNVPGRSGPGRTCEDAPPRQTDYSSTFGTSAPFNSMVSFRHYYLRSGGHEADIQVNLKPKSKTQSAEPRNSQEDTSRIEAIASEISRGSRQNSGNTTGPPVLRHWSRKYTVLITSSSDRDCE